jgi:hypothetical protein
MLAIAGLRWAGCLPKTPNMLLLWWLWQIASPSHLEQMVRGLWPELRREKITYIEKLQIFKNKLVPR